MSQMLQIHARLRDMVLSLDLGPGERLSERLLEREFNGSRTPVRAALLKIGGGGAGLPRRSQLVVAPIDLGEIAALAEFRLPLEETRCASPASGRQRRISRGRGLLDRCQPACLARNGTDRNRFSHRARPPLRQPVPGARHLPMYDPPVAAALAGSLDRAVARAGLGGAPARPRVHPVATNPTKPSARRPTMSAIRATGCCAR